MGKFPHPEEVVDKGAAWAARSGCDLDAKIRKHGYVIHSRKKGQEPRWELGGKVYSQSEVLRRIGENP